MEVPTLNKIAAANVAMSSERDFTGVVSEDNNDSIKAEREEGSMDKKYMDICRWIYRHLYKVVRKGMHIRYGLTVERFLHSTHLHHGYVCNCRLRKKKTSTGGTEFYRKHRKSCKIRLKDESHSVLLVAKRPDGTTIEFLFDYVWGEFTFMDEYRKARGAFFTGFAHTLAPDYTPSDSEDDSGEDE